MQSHKKFLWSATVLAMCKTKANSQGLIYTVCNEFIISSSPLEDKKLGLLMLKNYRISAGRFVFLSRLPPLFFFLLFYCSLCHYLPSDHHVTKVTSQGSKLPLGKIGTVLYQDKFVLLSKIVKTNSILHVDCAIDFVLLKTVLKGYVLFYFFSSEKA